MKKILVLGICVILLAVASSGCFGNNEVGEVKVIVKATYWYGSVRVLMDGNILYNISIAESETRELPFENVTLEVHEFAIHYKGQIREKILVMVREDTSHTVQFILYDV